MDRGCGVQNLMGRDPGACQGQKKSAKVGEYYSKMTQERNTGARPHKVSPEKRGFGLSLRGPWWGFGDLKSAS